MPIIAFRILPALVGYLSTIYDNITHLVCKRIWSVQNETAIFVTHTYHVRSSYIIYKQSMLNCALIILISHAVIIILTLAK